MHGLPPLPADFVQITADWAVGGSQCSTSWRVFAPGADDATSTELEALLGDFFFFAVPDLLSVLPSDVSCSVLRISNVGTAPFVIAYQPAPNGGAFGNCSVLADALVLTWRSSEPRLGGHSHSWLPLAQEFVGPDRRTLRELSWSEAQSAARSFALHVNGLTSPDGGLCVLAAVHRSHAGIPLAATTWAPVELGDASPRIGHLSRRLNPSGQLSSP